MRYQEARHVGDALTRDALRQLATDDRRATVVDHRGEPAPRRPRRGGRASRSPAPVRCTSSRSTTAPPCPTQVVRTIAGEGISTVVVGQKIRWVLEMMRGPELAGARIARVERPHARPTAVVEFTFHDAAPGETELDLEATKATLLALGEAGATIAIRQRRAPVREVVVRRRSRCPASAGARTARSRAPGPATAVQRRGAHARQRAPAGRGRSRRRHASPSRPTASAGRALNRYVDGGDGGDTYNYSPPDGRHRRRSTRVACECASTKRARCAREPSSPPPTGGPRTPSATNGRAHAAATTPVSSTCVTTLELRTGERFLRVHVELDHQVRDHRLRAHFPLLQRRRRLRRRVRVRGGRTAG